MVAFDASFVSNGTDNVAGFYIIVTANFQSVGRHGNIRFSFTFGGFQFKRFASMFFLVRGFFVDWKLFGLFVAGSFGRLFVFYGLLGLFVPGCILARLAGLLVESFSTRCIFAFFTARAIVTFFVPGCILDLKGAFLLD